MILVTGAAGKTGRAVITALRKRQVPIRALAHRVEQEKELQDLGAGEIVVGDMGDPAILKKVTNGIHTIYLICPNINPDELNISKKVLEAATNAGISHFVYHSVLHPQVEAMPHHWLKMRVEEKILESGLPFTILQPTAYMQNIFQGWEAITSQRLYSVPYHPKTRLSIVDLEDVAEAAAVVMTEPEKHINGIYELCGPQPLSQTEVAEILSKELHHPVSAAFFARDEWAKKMKSSGMNDYERETLLKMFEYYEQFNFHGNPHTLSCLIKRSPTAFQEVVRKQILRKKMING